MSHDDFTWRPRDGLLQQYVDVFGPTTDAPVQSHLFGGFALMAAALGRKVYLRDGAAKLFPNLFVLLLGPSSLYRKSTCVGNAQDSARELEGVPEIHDARTPPGSERLLLPNQFTPESLL